MNATSQQAPDCDTCLDAGWLPVREPGDPADRDWIEPCPCRPAATAADAARLAAAQTGRRAHWAPGPAGRPYLGTTR